jgi:hypothetical protein
VPTSTLPKPTVLGEVETVPSELDETELEFTTNPPQPFSPRAVDASANASHHAHLLPLCCLSLISVPLQKSRLRIHYL